MIHEYYFKPLKLSKTLLKNMIALFISDHLHIDGVGRSINNGTNTEVVYRGGERTS